MQRLRNVEPAVYNPRRLKELPIPDTGNQSTVTNDSIHDSHDLKVSDESRGSDEHNANNQLSFANMSEEVPINEMIDDQNMHDTDPLGDALFQGNTKSSVCIEGYTNTTTDRIAPLQIVAIESMANAVSSGNNSNNHDSETDSMHSITVEDQQTFDDSQSLSEHRSMEWTNDTQPGTSITGSIVKPEYVPLFSVHSANNEAMDQLLEEQEEIPCDEDVQIIVGPSGIPQPMQVTTDDLVKRENDAMSGNIPFNTSVSQL